MKTFLFENHDEAYFIWKKEGFKDETVVHVDGHLDFDWIQKKDPHKLLEVDNFKDWKKLLEENAPFDFNDEAARKNFIHIGNYIHPALQEGLVKEFYWVVPDPIWESSQRKLLINDLIFNFKKHQKGKWEALPQKNSLRLHWEDKTMIVLGLKDLERIEKPVLIDIDVDYLLTPSLFFMYKAKLLRNRFPRMWADELIQKLKAKITPKLTTIAYSVEGGYTPILFKFLGNEIKEILDGTHDPDNRFYQLRRQALEAFRQNEWDQSISLLLKAFDLRPKDPSIAWALAESHWAKGEKKPSANYHQMAIGSDPSYRTEFNTDGIRLEILKKRRMALKEFEKIMARDPSDPKAKSNAGWIHLYYNRYQKAYEFFRGALELDETWGDTYLGLGYIAMKRKKFKEAQFAFEKAIQYKTLNKAVYYWLGKVLEKQGLLKQSVHAYNKFIRLGQHNLLVGLKLAWTYWRQGAIYKAQWELQRLGRVMGTFFKKKFEILDWNLRKLAWRLS